MVFSPALFVWLLLTFIPLQIKPQFLVKELEACCHHKIHLKCKGNEKIAIIQSRYVVSSREPKANPYRSSGEISSASGLTLSSNASHLSHKEKSYLSLWDMDVEFTHDLKSPRRPIRNDLSSLNTPEWANQHRVRNGGHRYTTLNPLLHGLKFTSERILEMPPYESPHDRILDKETLWTQPLFPLNNNEDNNEISGRRAGSVSSMSGRSASVLVKTHVTSDPVPPCVSYETMAETTDEFMGNRLDSKRRKWPRPQWHYKDLRPVFNRRCSGRSECVVNLMRNKLRDQDLTSVCQKWPEGRILVKYLCFNSFSGDVHSKCNEDLGSASEGFILNPGYPEIYAGDNPCQWRLHLPEPHQKILLLFLDISLRGEEKSKCRDRIVVSEGQKRLLSTCGDHSSAIGILSSSNRLNVTFRPESRMAFPKRGFLIYFRAVGCSDAVKPLNSYLVFRNGSHALFRCEPGYAFPDSMTGLTWLACNSLKHSWNNGSLHCQETGLNLSMADPSNDFPWPSTTNIYNTEVFKDFAFPVGLILVVFVLNLFLLLWIHHKKGLILPDPEIQNDMNQELEEEADVHSPTPDEESTFTLSSGGFEMAAGERENRTWTFHHHQEMAPSPELCDDQSRTLFSSQVGGKNGTNLSRNGYVLLPPFNSDLRSSSIGSSASTSTVTNPPHIPDNLNHFPSIHRLPRSTAV